MTIEQISREWISAQFFSVSFHLHEVALGPSAIEHIEVLHKVGESKEQLSTVKTVRMVISRISSLKNFPPAHSGWTPANETSWS